jgi:hypothetical protein
VSGSIFCVIRSAPLYGYGYTGVSIFATQGRDQYLIEGIIVALWTAGAGLAAFFTIYATKLPFSILRHIGVLVSMSIFIILSIQIWNAYIDKTQWYSLKDTLPAEVWSWFASSIKKSTSLPKRLYRVSQIWLLETKYLPSNVFDTKVLKSFYKKFDALVIEYIKRQFVSSSK